LKGLGCITISLDRLPGKLIKRFEIFLYLGDGHLLLYRPI